MLLFLDKKSTYGPSSCINLWANKVLAKLSNSVWRASFAVT